MRLVFLISLSFVLSFIIPSWAATIADYSSTENDRFSSGFSSSPVENSSLLSNSFPANTFDFSGVGWDADSTGKAVTLISNQHFVVAKHFRPSGDVNFLNRDGDLVTLTIDVSGWVDLIHSDPPGGSTTFADLQIGTFTSAITESDKLATYAIAIGNEVDFLGRTTVMYGNSGGKPVIGTNRIEGVLTVSDVDGINYENETRSAATFQDEGVSGEFQVQGGDSGSPTFLVLDDELVVLGTHLATGTINGNTSTIDSMANFYTDQISAALIADGESLQTVVVPEPSTFVMVTGILGLIICRFRKRRI